MRTNNQDSGYKGYQEILIFFKQCQKESPLSFGKNKVSLTRHGNQVYLQFKTRNSDTKFKKSCNCYFTFFGIANALEKAHLVANKLKHYDSELEFWQWYDLEIKGTNNNSKNDLITFQEAFDYVESWFFGSLDNRGLLRSKTNKSDQRSYSRQYGCNFNIIQNPNEQVKLELILDSIKSKYPNKYEKRHQECITAFLKLCEVNNLTLIYAQLSKYKIKKENQIVRKRKKQSISLDEFIQFFNLATNDNCSKHELVYLEERKAYFWLFSLQVIYGLRIADTLAIKNIFNNYIPANDPMSDDDDTYCYQALVKSSNNVIYIGNYTCYGAKIKTGKRIAIPAQPVGYPDLFQLFKVKENAINPLDYWETDRSPISPNKRLAKWSLKWLGFEFTNTHALRRLCNANGISAGIPQEIRAMSLGHSTTMNDKFYKDFSTETQIKMMLSTKKQPIPLESAIKLVKQLNLADNHSVCELLANIYQLPFDDLIKLLSQI